MALAKERKLNPRQLAELRCKAQLDLNADVCEPVEIAGAGFLNFRLKPAALTDALNQCPRAVNTFSSRPNAFSPHGG